MRRQKNRTIKAQGFGVLNNHPDLVELCLPVPPSANRYWRMAKTHLIVSDEARQYKRNVALLCGQVNPFANQVAVRFTIYRARKSGDLDNYTKVLLDSLKGIVYADDSAVVEIHALRADDKNNPRVVISAWGV